MKRTITFALVAMAIFLAASCASTPKKGPDLPESLMQAKSAADTSRAKAMEIKAPVAAKDVFDQAETSYTSAKDLETATDYAKATTDYTSAAELFGKAYDEATAKKDAALKAMDAAASERKASEDALSKAADERDAAGTTGKGE